LIDPPIQLSLPPATLPLASTLIFSQLTSIEKSI
jgi:hypothetical protein